MISSPEKLLAQFIERQSELSAEYFGCADLDEAMRKLKAIIASEDWGKAVASRGIPQWMREACRDYAELLADGGDESLERDWIGISAKANFGLTQVWDIIADTGTLVIPSQFGGDRVTSLIPPIHVASIFGAVVHESLAEFMVNADTNLTYQFVTGPSRTADIEKQLVVGVHGPVRLLIFGPAVG